MKIYIGADHAGFNLKEKLKKSFKLTDLGNKVLDNDDDYPIFASKVAKAVSKDKKSLGILICGSGEGVCIAANKVKSIRAILAENVRDAYLSRKDDDANILCLQGRYTTQEKAKKIVNKFLETKFAKLKKYTRRIKQITRLEK